MVLSFIKSMYGWDEGWVGCAQSTFIRKNKQLRQHVKWRAEVGWAVGCDTFGFYMAFIKSQNLSHKNQKGAAFIKQCAGSMQNYRCAPESKMACAKKNNLSLIVKNMRKHTGMQFTLYKSQSTWRCVMMTSCVSRPLTLPISTIKWSMQSTTWMLHVVPFARRLTVLCCVISEKKDKTISDKDVEVLVENM